MANDNQMLGLIYSRRSIRSFTSEAVSAEQIQSLLEAAMAAPSARDRRPWEFVVVTDEAVREQLAQTHQFSSVAHRMPRMIGTGARKRAASTIASNCVLSPISAIVMRPADVQSASMLTYPGPALTRRREHPRGPRASWRRRSRQSGSKIRRLRHAQCPAPEARPHFGPAAAKSG